MAKLWAYPRGIPTFFCNTLAVCDDERLCVTVSKGAKTEVTITQDSHGTESVLNHNLTVKNDRARNLNTGGYARTQRAFIHSPPSFQNLQYEFIKEELGYGPQDLLCDIGGTLRSVMCFVSITRRVGQGLRADELTNERNVYFQPLNGRLAVDLLRIARGRLVFSHSELLHLRKFLQVRKILNRTALVSYIPAVSRYNKIESIMRHNLIPPTINE